METNNKNKDHSKFLFRYVIIAIIFWTLIVMGSLIWNFINIRHHILELAVDKARTHFEKDLAFRIWAMKHGGVYVPSNQRTPPNPYLYHIPDRDIVTPSGRRLTLMNPAYMMRQLNEENPQEDVSGHLTSLKPIRPENAPDEWEKRALRILDNGKKEVSELVEFNGVPFLRLMWPMIARKQCLKCHSYQGYKEGDVRGGESVSVSMIPYYQIENKQILILTITHSLIWITGLIAIGFMTYSSKKRISDQRQSKINLQKSEEKYRKFFEEDLTGNYISSPDGKLLFCNPAFIKIFGFESMEEALNCSLSTLYPSFDDRKAFLSELKMKKKLKFNKVKLRNCQGEYINIIQNVIGYFDQNDELIEIQGYLLDITENKKLQEQLIGAQKMEAVGILAGGIAHDFNNLLTVINGYSELLLRKSDDNEPIKKDLIQIQKAGERAASLTSQLLAFSRKQIIQPKVLNLNTIVTDIEKMLHRLIGEDIILVTMLNKELGNIKADKGQMDQVIMNLAVNARDAMPKGGRLTIETTNVYFDKDYAESHVAVKPGSYIMLAISDTGIGIDSETKSKIFDPFFTTKGKHKGTGLGLSTVYGIVKQNEGNIWVYSEIGEGTTFKVYLPQIEKAAGPDVKLKPAFDSLKGSETILLVEDDYDVRELSRTFLLNYGYSVIEADNGETALQMCKQHKDKIHLIVTDVIMPQMGGRILANKIGTLYPETKVLYMSGYTDNAIVHHGVLQADVDFLAKPFSPDGLAKKVREVLDTPKPMEAKHN